MADPELEEPFPELLAPLCLTDVDPAVTQHVLEPGQEGGQLKVRQIGVHPLFDWTPAVIVLEELDGELSGAHRRDHSRGNDRTRRRGGRRTSFPLAAATTDRVVRNPPNQTPTVPVRDRVRSGGPVQ